MGGVAPPAERMPRSAITQSGELVARMAALSPFCSPRLSSPQATPRTLWPVSFQVSLYQIPSRRPDIASRFEDASTWCWNRWTRERNAISLMGTALPDGGQVGGMIPARSVPRINPYFRGCLKLVADDAYVARD